MTRYMTFMHGDAPGETSPDHWDAFFARARESGMFIGGSALGPSQFVGPAAEPACAHTVAGYMLFETDAYAELESLLQHHPVAMAGGTVEVRELVRT